MNKATREELLDAMAKYDAANAAFNAAPRISEFESMPEWDALGVARDNLRVAGWPKDLAYSMGPVAHGYRPINGKFPRRAKAM